MRKSTVLSLWVLLELSLPTVVSASESRTQGAWLGLYSAPYPSLWSLGYRREIKPYLHVLGAVGHYPFLTAFAMTAGASVRFKHPSWALSPFLGGGASAAYQNGSIAVGTTAWTGSGFKFSFPVSAGVEWTNADGIFLAWTNQFPIGATGASLVSGIEVGFLF